MQLSILLINYWGAKTSHSHPKKTAEENNFAFAENPINKLERRSLEWPTDLNYRAKSIKYQGT